MGRGEVPFGQISVDKGWQRIWTVEQFGTMYFYLVRRVLQRFFDQFILGGEVGIEAAMGKSQRFHKRLQPRRTYTVASETYGRFLNDALMGLGLMVLGIPHDGCLLISNSHHMPATLRNAVGLLCKGV